MVKNWYSTKNYKQASTPLEITVLKHSFECSIGENNRKEVIELWDVNFSVTNFKEHCSNDEYEFNNIV